MYKTILSLVLVLFLLAGCAMPMMHGEGGAGQHMGQQNDMGQQNGMGMGSNSGMMARHHATIPDEYSGLTSSVAADDESLARGAELYSTNCATCHGDGGMGDGPAGKTLDPVASPIAHTSQMLGDDYLFWRISEGGAEFQSAMPPWKDVLDEQARWDLINYVRALGSGDAMPKQKMGGAMFDPAKELAQREAMLASGVEQGVIKQAEADEFMTVHAAMDELMQGNGQGNGQGDGQGGGQHGAMQGNMEERQGTMLAALVEAGTITQAQSDAFQDIHSRLLDSGLMQ